MADFVQALHYVIENEGQGFETWPQTDQPTNTGIIAADVAEFYGIPLSQVGAIQVKALTQEEVQAIYKKLYWDRLRLDEVTDQGIATCIFDTGVNRGNSVAIKYAQRACNLLGGALVVDGQLGLRTLGALNQMDRSKFISTFENLETAGYLAIVAAHPEDQRYLKGWMTRARRLFSLCSNS